MAETCVENVYIVLFLFPCTSTAEEHFLRQIVLYCETLYSNAINVCSYLPRDLIASSSLDVDSQNSEARWLVPLVPVREEIALKPLLSQTCECVVACNEFPMKVMHWEQTWCILHPTVSCEGPALAPKQEPTTGRRLKGLEGGVGGGKCEKKKKT